MDREERAILKRILMYIKIARRTDHITYQFLMNHPAFTDNLRELEKLCGWNAVDQSIAQEHANSFVSQTQGKTLKEKGEKMHGMAHRFGKLLLGAAVVGAAGYGVAKSIGAIGSHGSQKEKEEKEKTPSEEGAS